MGIQKEKNDLNVICEKVERIAQDPVENYSMRLVGKVIHWESCKKFKFDHTNKCYMDNPESDWENEAHKILSDFEM